MQARAESAKATLDQATRDEQRSASLISTNAISKADYDAAKARLEIAKAGVSEAQTMLGYAKVTAPFAGVITRNNLADQGDFAAPGKPLLDLENPEQLRVEADIPEALIANLKVGASLEGSLSPDTQHQRETRRDFTHWRSQQPHLPGEARSPCRQHHAPWAIRPHRRSRA